MKLSQRVKKIRELLGHKQGEVASIMGITQQGYSAMERCADSAGFETLKRFASAVRVDISFIVGDAPITEEMLNYYGGRPYSVVVTEHKKARQKVILFEELLTKK